MATTGAEATPASGTLTAFNPRDTLVGRDSVQPYRMQPQAFVPVRYPLQTYLIQVATQEAAAFAQDCEQLKAVLYPTAQPSKRKPRKDKDNPAPPLRSFGNASKWS